jgi:hypothetical protein
MALATAKIWKESGLRIIGISTKEGNTFYDESYRVAKYDFALFPPISPVFDGWVYFPLDHQPEALPKDERTGFFG